MSQANVEVVRELFDAVFVRHDPAFLDGTVPDTVHRDIEIDSTNSKMANRGVYALREAIRNLQENMDVWEVWRTDAEEIIDAGDEIVVVTHLRARGKGSGVDVEARGAMVWTLRDGKVVRLKTYQSKHEALEAVTLGGVGVGGSAFRTRR